MSPSSRPSLTPVTVTVCAVFQFAAVKVSDAGADRALGRVVRADSPTVTSAVGCASSTTVNVAVPPASVVVSPLVGVTVIPDVSLSVFVTLTSVAFDPVVVAVAHSSPPP